MKYILLLSFIGTPFIKAQTSMNGYVTLQNSGNKTAFPAQVKAFGATTTDVNSSNGYFSLLFDQKSPGDEVHLTIEKPGYEVVNRKELDARLAHPEEWSRPLKLYMCPIGQWQEYADKFYHINASEINKTFQRQLKELNIQYKKANSKNKDYEKARIALEKAKKLAEIQAEQLAEKFAKANLDDQSERFKLAYRLFSEGKIDSVLIVLKEDEMENDWEKAEKALLQGKELDSIGQIKIENATQALNSSAKSCIIAAESYALQGNWELAENNYKKALQVAPTEVMVWDNFIRYKIEKLDIERKPDEYLNRIEEILTVVEQAVTHLNTEQKGDWRSAVQDWILKLESAIPETENKHLLHLNQIKNKLAP